MASCATRSCRTRASPPSAARRPCEANARQAAAARRELNLPHHARLARRAFQRIAIPFGGVGRGLIGALEEFEQRLVGGGGCGNGLVGQNELAHGVARE